MIDWTSVLNTLITAAAGGGGVAVLVKAWGESKKRRAQKRAARERQEEARRREEEAAQDPAARTAEDLEALARIRAWAYAEVEAADGRVAQRDRQVSELLTRVGTMERDFAQAVAHIRTLEDVIRRGDRVIPPWPPLKSDDAAAAADAP